MNILVTGASGQLGQSVRDASLSTNHNFIFTDICPREGVLALDITDADSVRKMLIENDVNAIVNCAAYTDVNKAESDQECAYRINELAPGILAQAALSASALLIHVSTDYVFDGTAFRPYTEDAKTCPVSVYGKSKLAGEKAIEASGCRYVILRTAWLYSNYGRNFYKTMVELTESRSSLKVVSDQIGTPTLASDLAEAIVGIIETERTFESGVYHYSNEGACSWYDFAKEICNGVGHKCEVMPCRTEDFPTPASRPHYSVLDKTKFKDTFGIEVPYWRESLMACIERRQA